MKTQLVVGRLLKETHMIRHVASIGEIVEDVEATVTFYRDVLGLEVDYDAGKYTT